jgi:hypothetical protein
LAISLKFPRLTVTVRPFMTPPRVSPRSGSITAVICACLLLVFAVLAHLSVTSKSATYDEPLHATSAWLQVHFSDFRIDPEDPALWKYWASIPNGRSALRTPSNLDEATAYAANDAAREWPFVQQLLYRDEQNLAQAEDFIGRSRNMMLVVAVALGGLIAWWSWRLGGLVAAGVATGFFAFDPNFLGHASLVKNDVPLSLLALGLIIAVWRMGQRATPWNILAVALLCAAAVATKFSALLFGPIVAVLLIVRGLLPIPWRMLNRELNTIPKKLALSLAACLFAGLISYAGVWAVYQFRFRPAPAPDATLGTQRLVEYTNRSEIRASTKIETPTTQQVRSHPLSSMTRTVLFLDKHHLLPQAFLNGFLYTYQSALARKTFLLGDYSHLGWWYYFPLAMLLKSPLALIVAAVLALGVYIAALRARASKETSCEQRNAARWTAACLAIPPVLYMLAAMRSNLNLGLRHVLPVYPFLFIGIGLAAAYLWRATTAKGQAHGFRPGSSRRIVQISTSLLLLALIIESLLNFPDYIAFFNAPAKPHRLMLLGDSNLDWGQDLKLLATFQKQHLKARPNSGQQDLPLYLVYFGFADPWAYDVDYINFPGGYPYGPAPQVRSDPGILAISATALQGIYHNPDLRKAYGQLKTKRPRAILGGTIYCYEWPPQLQQDINAPPR